MENVGYWDRIARIVIGMLLLLIYAGYSTVALTPILRVVLLVVALIALVTGISAYCPMYQTLGMNTAGGKAEKPAKNAAKRKR